MDDLADACVFLMLHYNDPMIVNVGSGLDVTIRDLVDLVQRTTGYQGKVVFDAAKPDGTPRKLLDVSRINALGWKARIPLEEGIASTYRWYLENQAAAAVAVAG